MRLVAVVGIKDFVECGFLGVRHTYLLIGSFHAYRFIIMGFIKDRQQRYFLEKKRQVTESINRYGENLGLFGQPRTLRLNLL
jgi:hypothetical protein